MRSLDWVRQAHHRCARDDARRRITIDTLATICPKSDKKKRLFYLLKFYLFFVCRASVCCGSEGIVAVRMDVVFFSEIEVER